jgi:hypothetical protein
MSVSNRKLIVMALGMLLASFGTSANPLGGTEGDMQSLIVQGADRASVKAAVEAVGGQLTHELGVINAFGIRLPEGQRAALAAQPAVKMVSVNQTLVSAAKNGVHQGPAQSADEHPIHTQEIMGTGVNVMVVDSGKQASVVVGVSSPPDAPSYIDAICAIDWAIANKDEYNIRVLRLPFNAQPPSTDTGNPLYQAVIAAQRAQIDVLPIGHSTAGI